MTTGLLFSGQGAQVVGMGQTLCDNAALARDLYDEADQVLGWSVRELSFNGPEQELTQTSACQPALYVMGYTIFALLKEAGKLDNLKAALGLSLGELTALAAAGSFSFADGLRVVAERGRLMQLACDASEGAMASFIGGELSKVEEICREHDIDMANLNCPGQVVVSGESAKVAAAVEAGKASGGFKMIMPLKVAGAYHSRLMEPARAAFADYLANIEIRPPQVAVFTNTTGGAVSEPQAIREALIRQVVSSVKWESCMRSAAELGIETFYECGPGAVLAGLARRTERSWKVTSLAEFTDLPI